MIRIFENIDCMEGMEKYADLLKSRKTLAIIDTPYGIGEDGERNHSRGSVTKFKYKGTNITRKNNAMQKPKFYKPYVGGDKEPPSIEYWNKLLSLSKNQIIWGANHFISRIPFDSSCWIVWDKDNGESDFADCELAWASFKTAVRKFKFRWNGMLQEDMLNKEERIHINQKPIALYKWLLEKYSAGHDLILDTHAGSASSLIACEDFGIDYIGFELDSHYYNLANERLLKARFEREAKKSEVCVVNGLGLFEGVNG